MNPNYVTVVVKSGPFKGRERRVEREAIHLELYHRRKNCRNIRVGDLTLYKKVKVDDHTRARYAACPACIKKKEDK